MFKEGETVTVLLVLFLEASFFVLLQNYTLWTLSVDGSLLSTWKQLPKRSNKLSSFLWTDSRKEYSGEYLSKLRRFFYEFFIHYLFSPFQMFSLSAKRTRIIILKLRLHTLMVYCKLQFNLLLTILKLINPGIV